MKILYIGAGTGENPWLAEAVRECHGTGVEITVIQNTSEQLDAEEKAFAGLLGELGSCDLLIVSHHGAPRLLKNSTAS